MDTFFVSVLISLALLGVDPPQGWMQNEMEFDTKQECEEFIPEIMPIIYDNVMIWSGGAAEILMVDCLTEPDWLARNIELGHEVPDTFVPKSRKKIEGT